MELDHNVFDNIIIPNLQLLDQDNRQQYMCDIYTFSLYRLRRSLIFGLPRRGSRSRILLKFGDFRSNFVLSLQVLYAKPPIGGLIHANIQSLIVLPSAQSHDDDVFRKLKLSHLFRRPRHTFSFATTIFFIKKFFAFSLSSLLHFVFVSLAVVVVMTAAYPTKTWRLENSLTICDDDVLDKYLAFGKTEFVYRDFHLYCIPSEMEQTKFLKELTRKMEARGYRLQKSYGFQLITTYSFIPK